MSQFTFTAKVTSNDNFTASASQPFTVNPVAHVGCTVFQADYTNAISRWDGSANYFDSYLSRTMAGNVQKTYFTPGQYPGTPGSPISTDLYNGSTGLIDKGVRLWLCYQPSLTFNTTDANNLVASINAFKAVGWKGKIVLWQEPQDNKKNLGAAAFTGMFQPYYNYLKGPSGTSCTVVYNASSQQGESAVQTYYPGDAFCDEVAQDLYGVTYWGTGTVTPNGVTMATLQSIAINAKPKPKPLNWGEMGSALNASKIPTNAQVGQYIQYGQTLFTGHAGNGYPIGDVMWYDGNSNSPTNGGWNTINSGDFRIPYLQALYDALNI